MSLEIWLAIIAIVAAPVGSALTAVLMRRKYNTEISKLKSEVRGSELENVRTGNDILMSQIVEPLRTELKHLRADVNKFRRAIEKITVCPMAAECPVSRELRADEKNDVGATADRGHDGAGS